MIPDILTEPYILSIVWKYIDPIDILCLQAVVDTRTHHRRQLDQHLYNHFHPSISHTLETMTDIQLTDGQSKNCQSLTEKIIQQLTYTFSGLENALNDFRYIIKNHVARLIQHSSQLGLSDFKNCLSQLSVQTTDRIITLIKQDYDGLDNSAVSEFSRIIKQCLDQYLREQLQLRIQAGRLPQSKHKPKKFTGYTLFGLDWRKLHPNHDNQQAFSQIGRSWRTADKAHYNQLADVENQTQIQQFIKDYPFSAWTQSYLKKHPTMTVDAN